MTTPTPSISATTSGQGTPACSEIAASALTSASTEPTERSIPAVVMTKVIATATIISGAICRRMLRRLTSVRKVSVISEKVTTMTTKNTAMLSDASVVVDDQSRALAQACGDGGRGQAPVSLAPRAPAETELEFSPDDQIDDLLDVRLADEPLGDVATLVQHHDAVADHEQVLQPVGDQNDADALRADRANEVEHRVDLGDRERGGRLVHDEDERIERDRAPDRDALALAAGKVLDLEPRARHADAEMLEHLRGLGVHLALVHERHAEDAPERLAAEQEVAGDVDRVAERQVLIDHLDPLAPRVGGRSEADFTAVEDDARRNPE